MVTELTGGARQGAGGVKHQREKSLPARERKGARREEAERSGEISTFRSRLTAEMRRDETHTRRRREE